MDSNLDLKDAPLIKRIREVGLRTALFEAANEVVWRLTPGIDIAELRAILRGDPPARPNPRLRPHADGFWFHIRPGYYHQDVTGLYPTFRLGYLSTYFFVLEFLTGLFLMVFYTPSTRLAYDNMLDILSNVPLGSFMRDLHRLGAEAMVIIVALHMLRTFWTASYKKPRGYTWATGVLLLVCTLGLSYTGYLLPWDQLAYWAVTIGASMAEAAPPPIVGAFVNILIKGAPDLGQAGLLRFYLLHVIVFPAALIALLGMHYYKVVLHGHSLPPEKEATGEDTAKRIPVDKRVYYIPDILSSELLWAAVVSLIMAFAVTFLYSAPLENWANPQSTPLHTIAPWYFLWIQGMLKLGDKTLTGVIIPTILVVAFMLWPYYDVGPFRRYHMRRLAISLSLLFIVFIVLTSWMGTPAFAVQTSRDQEIFFELSPTEKPGLIQEVPYNELLIGTYCTDEESCEAFNEGKDCSAEPNPCAELYTEALPLTSKLYHVMEEYEHMVARARDLPVDQGGLPNAIATMSVRQIQAHLKGVTMAITWDNQNDPSKPLSNSQLVPVHQDGYLSGED
jgi:ubiquinol-cytochrome c reductase cytochrome b subunit